MPNSDQLGSPIGEPLPSDADNRDIHEGGCACGSVRYRTIGPPANVIVCHCDWCQRRTGSGFAVLPKFHKKQVEVLSGDLTLYKWRSTESDRWLEVRFCPTCGSNIGFTQELRPDAYAIEAGTFDDPSWMRADKLWFRHIFTRSGQAWSDVPEGHEAHHGHFLPKDAGIQGVS